MVFLPRRLGSEERMARRMAMASGDLEPAWESLERRVSGRTGWRRSMDQYLGAYI